MKIFLSCSSAETKELGRKLAKQIPNSLPGRQAGLSAQAGKFQILRRKNALVFALSGELGSGKTTFVQGFLRGLGIRRRTTSPTFIILRKFNFHPKTPHLKPKTSHVYHIDAYRIKKPRELLALGIKDIFSDPKNIVLVEWADNVKKILPRLRRGFGGRAGGAVWVKFAHGKKENERTIKSDGLVAILGGGRSIKNRNV